MRRAGSINPQEAKTVLAESPGRVVKCRAESCRHHNERRILIVVDAAVKFPPSPLEVIYFRVLN